jgi:5-methylcytosine-specific restriction enzyme A
MAWSKTSRHERGYGTVWTKLRKAILQRDHYLCQHCLAKGIATQGNHVDHIKPKAKGGTDEPSNLQVLCTKHHSAKSAKESVEARGRIYRERPRIGIDGWPIID